MSAGDGETAMNWKAIGIWGLVLGLACVIWQLVMGFTGWYKDPVLANVFLLVVIFNIVVIVLGLRQTRAENGYGKQVLHGLLMGVVAGVLIVCGSLLFTSVIAPDYAAEMADLQEVVLAERGVDAEMVAAIADRTRNTPPIAYAIQGFIGTLVTSLFVSLIVAIFLRRKG